MINSVKNKNYTDIAYLVKNFTKHRLKEAKRTPVSVKNYTDISITLKKVLKNNRTEKLLSISLISSSLLLVFLILFNIYHSHNFFSQNKAKSSLLEKSQILGTSILVLPVRLTIPKINIDAEIEHVGVTSEGSMEVPTNIDNVGWFKLGPRPGEKGSAVISGHVDGKNGGAGVFAGLYKLKKGDKVYVEDGRGMVATFIVKESRLYDPGYAEDVFSWSENAKLNLVTCDGVWDENNKSYSKRLVIFTERL